LKLLLATQDFPPTEGGMARYYADLAAGFPEGSCVVSTTRPEGPAGPPPAGVLIHHEPFSMAHAHRMTSLWRWGRDLERLIAEERPHVVICGNIRPLGPLCARIAERTGRPYYVIIHGNDLLAARRRWSGLRSGTWSRVFGGARRWIANSEAVRKIGIDDLGLSETRSAVVPPEVDTSRFRPAAGAERHALRSSLGVAPGERLLVHIGRLVARKGLDHLLEALQGFSGRERWRLVVAGFGDSSPYEASARALGIADRVTFRVGVPSEDLVALLQSADLVVLPSRTIPERGDIEGFGIVFLEAAACGVPVVAGNSGGVVEAVEDGVTGLIVDGNDVPAIRSAMERLLADDDLRARMGGAARARAEKQFGPGRAAARLGEVIAEDLGERL
jgi:phosphatidylinositol alpha-1,6-mannosyltransferase